MARARREGAAAAVRSAASALAPAAWPQTPGFESAPLRWRSEEWNLVSFAVEAAPGRLALLLVEDPGDPEGAFGPLFRAIGTGRPLMPAFEAVEIVRRIRQAEPACRVSAAVWSGERLSVAACGTELPMLLRAARPVPAPVSSQDGVSSADLATSRGDLLLLSSSGLGLVRFTSRPIPPEELLVWLGRESLDQPIASAFAKIVAEGKKIGASPGPRDVLLLAGRRLA